MTPQETITLIAVLLVGSGLLAYSIKLFYTIRLIKNSDEIAIAEATNRTDTVQITGQAREYEETVTSPIEGTDCFAYEYDISKSTRDTADPSNDYRWNTVDEATTAVDFILEDYSGTAYIQTADAELSLTHDTRHTVTEPSAIQTTVASDTPLFSPTRFDFSDRLRFKEGTISAGDRIFVIGTFTAEGMKNGETIETVPGETLYISDEDTDGELKRLRTPAVTTFVFGSVFLLFGLAYIAVEVL